MNINGVGPSAHISPTDLGKRPANPGKSAESATITEATTTDISDEAKALSKHSGKANPHQVAEALGAKNFGQALKILKEAGVDLNSGFVSDLVHGDEAALAQVQEALAPPPKETPTEEVTQSNSDMPVDITTQPSETESLVIDVSETNFTPTEVETPAPVSEELSLVDLLVKESPDENAET